VSLVAGADGGRCSATWWIERPPNMRR
jgi:hypothetical protein